VTIVGMPVGTPTPPGLVGRAELLGAAVLPPDAALPPVGPATLGAGVGMLRVPPGGDPADALALGIGVGDMVGPKPPLVAATGGAVSQS